MYGYWGQPHSLLFAAGTAPSQMEGVATIIMTVCSLFAANTAPSQMEGGSEQVFHGHVCT